MHPLHWREPALKNRRGESNQCQGGAAVPNTTVAQEQNNKNLTAGAESEALRVYIDPETGEFTNPPEQEAGTARKQALPAASSTSHQGLEEKPSPVEGGGTMVDLKGRFRSPLTATIDGNGKTKIGHQVSDNKE